MSQSQHFFKRAEDKNTCCKKTHHHQRRQQQQQQRPTMLLFAQPRCCQDWGKSPRTRLTPHRPPLPRCRCCCWEKKDSCCTTAGSFPPSQQKKNFYPVPKLSSNLNQFLVLGGFKNCKAVATLERHLLQHSFIYLAIVRPSLGSETPPFVIRRCLYCGANWTKCLVSGIGERLVLQIGDKGGLNPPKSNLVNSYDV